MDRALLREEVKILATIAERAAAAGLPFLIIGGNAVIAYGYARMTRDLDLMVREQDRRMWDELMQSLDYSQYEVSRAFQMYNPGPAHLPPVDLMLVDAATMEKLANGAQTVDMEGTNVRIPSLVHLIALKLHALRQGDLHRHTRDFGDVVELVLINKVDLASAEYAAILERYADAATREKLSAALPGSFGPQSPGV
jgi:predicted nucleotidyltransferase